MTIFYFLRNCSAEHIGCIIIARNTANGHTCKDILKHEENIERDMEKTYLMNSNNLHRLIKYNRVQCV